MFAVFNTNGLNFRSTIDNLYNLKKIDNISSVKNQIEEGKPQNFSVPQENLYQGPITKKAQDAYKKTARMNIKEPIYEVNQLMRKEIITVGENATIQECYDLMVKYKIKQIPIINQTQNIRGLITQNIILDALINDLNYVNHTANKAVIEVVKEDVITSDPISDIRRIAKVMVDFNLNAMPIVSQEDKIVGIVSRTDILKAVATIPPLQLWA